MTEEIEEQAEHQACAHIGITSYIRNPDAYSLFKTGFRVGARWGMEHAIQWHDLRKCPEDLPNPNTPVLICFRFEKWTTTYIAYYRPSIKKWQIYNLLEAQREPIVDDYIDSEEVIAWCELPQFKG